MTLKDPVTSIVNAGRATSRPTGDTPTRAKPAGQPATPTRKLVTTGRRTVGLVGLGAMGMGVARNLLAKGFTLYACDTRAKARASAAKLGAITAASAADIAPHVDVLIILVVNADQTEAVLFGTGGAAAALQAGSVVVASSTMPPAFVEALGERLTAIGLRLVDAPVSGGAVGANAGTLTIMASGAPAAFDQVDDVFKAIAARVYRLGDAPGMGSKVKMINQLLAGVHIASAAEAMALGIRAGIDPHQLFEVISNSAGSSWMFQNRVPHILAGDFTPLSAVDIFVKDLGIVLDSARAMKFPLPLTASAQQMFLATSAAGLGGEDDSAVIKMFARLSGIELPKGRRVDAARAATGKTEAAADKPRKPAANRVATEKASIDKAPADKGAADKQGGDKTPQNGTGNAVAARHASRLVAKRAIKSAAKSAAASDDKPPTAGSPKTPPRGRR